MRKTCMCYLLVDKNCPILNQSVYFESFLKNDQFFDVRDQFWKLSMSRKEACRLFSSCPVFSCV